MLYIITDGLHYKLGYSQDPKARLKDLQTANAKLLVLLGTTEGNIEDEKRYHKLLAKDKLVGEWFSPSYELFEILGHWYINKPVNLPALIKPDRLKNIRIHKTKSNTLWFNLTDISKLIKVRVSSLAVRKNITAKLFKPNRAQKLYYVDEESFLALFKKDLELLQELKEYKAQI